MSVEASSSEWLRVKLPEKITTATASALLAKRTPAERDAPLDLDLTNVAVVDITGLMIVLSALNERSSAGLETRISLPRHPEAINLLLDSEFPSAAAMVTRPQLGTLHWTDGALPLRDQVRLLLRPPPSRPSSTAYERLRDERFFGFLTYSFQAEPQVASIITTEWSRWRGPLILSFLDTALTHHGAEIARVVIYELLTNAVLHPEGDLLTVGSWVDSTGGDRAKELVISVWDNGKSMIGTLRNGLSENRPIRVAEAAVDDTFVVDASAWQPRWPTYTARWTPGRDAADEELLLASVFPGISHRQAKAPPNPVLRGREFPQGYGLHALYRCAADLFGGSLEIRTGNQQLNLVSTRRHRHRGVRRYRAHVARVPGQPFHGNLLTVRIPLRHAR